MNELISACNLLGWNTKTRQEQLLVEVCPFCGNRKFNFEISSIKFVYHCWACNTSGSLRGLNKYFPLGNFAKDSKVKLEKVEVFGLTSDDTNSLKIFDKFIEINKLDKDDRKAIELFCHKRGISWEEAIEYKIRYATSKIQVDERDRKKYTNRIIVPLFDISGSLVFFTGRSIDDKSSLKYLNCDVKRKRFLPVYLGKSLPNIVLLVEGVFDAIAIHQIGFSAIPLLSMDISEMQLFALMGIGFDKIVIALDAGEFNSSYKLYNKLSKMGLNPYVFLREGEDFDCLDRAKLKIEIDNLLSKPEASQDTMFLGKVSHLLKSRR